MTTLRRALAAALAALTLSTPPALATEGGVGYSTLTYVCPSPGQIDFAWAPADGAVFYSLQLAGPLDPTLNGGINGNYLRQFNTIEVTKGTMQNASVSVNLNALALPASLQWQIMAGGKKGYLGLVPLQQVVSIPMPCTANIVQVGLSG
jgi:hypothetical protein